MQHRNTVLHRLLSHIRWHHFDAHVEHHASDKHVRTLSTKTQFIAMAYGQLAGADSLRETVTRFNSQGAKLYHLGAKPIARSTVADANAKRPSRVRSRICSRASWRWLKAPHGRQALTGGDVFD